MARTVTWNELRDLAAFEAESGCAVSIFVNLDPSVSPTAAEVDTRLRSLLDEGAKTAEANGAELDHAGRQALRADLARIRAFYDEEFVRDGAHGLAVFAASREGVWRTIPLVAPVEDEIHVGRSFYLAPLVRLVGRGDGALVVSVSRERGQILRLQAGRLEELDDLFEHQRRRHDQGGWSQANYQRRIDNSALEHLRQVADHLEGLVRREPGVRVVVVAAGDSWAEFSELLSQEASSAVVGHATAEAHASPAELLAIAAPVLERWQEAEEAKTIERWRESVGRVERGAAGWAATLDAASDARVELLLHQRGAGRAVWRCPQCGRLAAAAGSCPLDGTTLEERPDGLDLLIHRTLLHGGGVHAVEHRRDLDPVEGVGAILRY